MVKLYNIGGVTLMVKLYNIGGVILMVKSYIFSFNRLISVHYS